MKKLIAVFCVLMLSFSLSACGTRGGTTESVVVTIGDSVIFTKEEIEAATKIVIEDFKDFEGCDLLRLWYDEAESNRLIESDSTYGVNRGSEDGGTLILLSDFYASGAGRGGGFNPDTTYTNWMWILVRESKTAEWTLESYGY